MILGVEFPSLNSLTYLGDMKYLLICLLGIFGSCASQKQPTTIDASTLETKPYIEQFIGGTPEAGVTTKFIFPSSLLGEEIPYNQIYEVRFRESVAKTVFKYAETGWLVAKLYPEQMIMSGDSEKEYGNPPPTTDKSNQADTVFIKYTDGEKIREVTVTNVSIRPAQYLPSQPKRK